MQNVNLKIEKNVKVGTDIYLMKLVGDTSSIKKPGEFINITVPGYYLRRPISVCDYGTGYVDILYKVLGLGTKDMSTFKEGMMLDCLVGLGNGFDITKAQKPLLVGGGIGIAPLVGLARAFNEKGIKPILVFGARSKNDIVLVEQLSELCDLHVCTDDGSLGFKGNVIECIKASNLDFDYYYSCGPQKMLEFLSKAYPNGCVSLEARMGCGFGACMGCSIETTKGPKRVCKEGPVFEATEVIF
ncbi:MAG: dihydroorotate dehydrogenase electron transfer subunit [Bacilli bacterium]|nr:dihydroorotate dehydrogenase electron transfer subunit [Bacilli bacterium]